MEDINNKNEEFLSRREFFKKAAKSALPFLAAIALADIPQIMKAASPSTGCRDFCSSGCGSGCADKCKGKCKAYCKDNCVNFCSDKCKGGCKGSCPKTCAGQCVIRCNAASGKK